MTAETMSDGNLARKALDWDIIVSPLSPFPAPPSFVEQGAYLGMDDGDEGEGDGDEGEGEEEDGDGKGKKKDNNAGGANVIDCWVDYATWGTFGAPAFFDPWFFARKKVLPKHCAGSRLDKKLPKWLPMAGGKPFKESLGPIAIFLSSGLLIKFLFWRFICGNGSKRSDRGHVDRRSFQGDMDPVATCSCCWSLSFMARIEMFLCPECVLAEVIVRTGDPEGKRPAYMIKTGFHSLVIALFHIACLPIGSLYFLFCHVKMRMDNSRRPHPDMSGTWFLPECCKAILPCCCICSLASLAEWVELYEEFYLLRDPEAEALMEAAMKDPSVMAMYEGQVAQQMMGDGYGGGGGQWGEEEWGEEWGEEEWQGEWNQGEWKQGQGGW